MLKEQGENTVCNNYIDEDCVNVLDEYIEDEAIRIFGPEVDKIYSRLDEANDDVVAEVQDMLDYPDHKDRFCLCDLREAIARALINHFQCE